MSSNFRYQTFVTVSGNHGGKVPVVDNVLLSHEQDFYPKTSLDENCIVFEFQTDRNYYVDLRQMYLALKLKFGKGCAYETYNTKEANRKEHIEEAKADKEATAAEEQEVPVPPVTHVNNIFRSIFSRCTSTIRKFTTLMDCMLTNLTFSTFSRGPSLRSRDYCTAG